MDWPSSNTNYITFSSLENILEVVSSERKPLKAPRSGSRTRASSGQEETLLSGRQAVFRSCCSVRPFLLFINLTSSSDETSFEADGESLLQIYLFSFLESPPGKWQHPRWFLFSRDARKGPAGGVGRTFPAPSIPLPLGFLSSACSWAGEA